VTPSEKSGERQRARVSAGEPNERIEPGLGRCEHVANPVETERTGSSPSHVVLISTRAPEEFNFVSIDLIACPTPRELRQNFPSPFLPVALVLCNKQDGGIC